MLIYTKCGQIALYRCMGYHYIVTGFHFSAGRGHYAAMDKTDTRAGYKARLVSPYINTTGKCLELFYWLIEQPSDDVKMRLNIIAISEDHNEDVLDTISDLTPHFPKFHLQLPDGINRIAIEGERSEDRKVCAMSLDDVTIMSCARFGKTNIVIKLRYCCLCTLAQLSVHF